MGNETDQDRIVKRPAVPPEGTPPGPVVISFTFRLGPAGVHVGVANTDDTVAQASGAISLDRRMDKGWLREAIANACSPAREKSEALAKRGNDPELLDDWNTQACAQELFRLLAIGCDADRQDRGTTRAISIDSLDAAPDPQVCTYCRGRETDEPLERHGGGAGSFWHSECWEYNSS